MRGKSILGLLVLFLACLAARSDAAKVVYPSYHPYYYPYYYHYAAPVAPMVVQSQPAQSNSAQSASAQSATINGVLALMMDRLANRPAASPANAQGSSTACQDLSASVEQLSKSVDKLNSLLSGVTTPPTNGGNGTGGFNPVPGGGLDAALKAAGAQGVAAQGATQGDAKPVTIDYRLALDQLAKQEDQKDRLDFLKWALANELIDGKSADAKKAKVDALIKAIEAVPVP